MQTRLDSLCARRGNAHEVPSGRNKTHKIWVWQRNEEKETIKRRIYRRSGRGNTRFTRVLERASDWQFSKREKKEERKKKKEISSRSGISLVSWASSSLARDAREPRTETGAVSGTPAVCHRFSETRQKCLFVPWKICTRTTTAKPVAPLWLPFSENTFSYF